MMLRNRSRSFTTKRAAMVDQPSLLSPSINFTCSPDSFFLGSPRFFNSLDSSFLGSPSFFNGYSAKHVTDSEISLVSSPVSILDSKNFLNPFDRKHSNSSTPSEHRNHTNRAIGLAALIDSIVEEKNDEVFNGSSSFSNPINRIKVQIPGGLPPVDSPKSPIEFGIKTRSPQVASPLSRSRHLIRQLSLKEMELCEDYTCVITYGPNPTTKHIFDEQIMENCDDYDHLQAEDSTPETNNTNPSDSSVFVTSAALADKDLYMYRGEKANCCHDADFKKQCFQKK